MPHPATARPRASLGQGAGAQRPQLAKLFSPHLKQRVSKRTRPACSLINTPLFTALVKLTLSTSSVTNTNTIAAGMSAHAVSWQQDAAARASLCINMAVCACSFTSCWAQQTGMVQHLVRFDRLPWNMDCAPDQLPVAQPIRGLCGTRAQHAAKGAAPPSLPCSLLLHIMITV